jgi:ACR3 family arsenite efflux pump ArsB
MVNRFNIVFRKYLLLWAFLAMVAGYLAGRFNPQRVESLRFLIAPLLFVMIFIMVFSTSLASLLKLKLYTYPMLVSFMLTVLSPLGGILVSRIIPSQFLFLRTGIVISTTVPPDAMLSAWTAFLEGDVLLTLIIQSFTFVVYLILIPFGLKLLLVNSSNFSLLILIKNLIVLIVIPLVLAGVIKTVFKKTLTGERLKRMKPTLSSISGIIEIFIILISIALRAEIITRYPVIIWWGVLTAALFYVIAFVAAYYIARLFRFGREISIPLIYQNGSKNLPIAMVIAITTFESRAILGVAACILAQFPISALFYSIFSRRGSHSVASPNSH